MGMKRRIIALVYISAMFSLSMSMLGVGVGAHVVLTSPAGGEIFEVGQEVSVSWDLNVLHVQIDWDLYFSPDGGATWQLVVARIPNAALSTTWTIAKTTQPTERGRLRIVQDNVEMDYESESFNFTIRAISTEAEIPAGIPVSSELRGTYPNPFSASTTIEYQVDESDQVRISVFDLQGRQVAVLVDTRKPAGMHSTVWSPVFLSPGTYLIRMETGNQFDSRTVQLVR